MADPARARRLAKRIMTIVAQEVSQRAKDPRLATVTFTAANLTSDLREATLYYTSYEPDSEVDTAAALESAKGRLRSIVGRETGIKFTPTLTFIADALPQQSAHIERLLAETRARDAALAEQAQGREYAADPNPYRDTAPDSDEPAPSGDEQEQ